MTSRGLECYGGTYNVAQRGHIAESVRVVARRSAAPPRYRRMAPRRQHARPAARARHLAPARSSTCSEPARATSPRIPTPNSPTVDNSQHRHYTSIHPARPWHSYVNNIWKLSRNACTLSHCRKSFQSETLTRFCLPDGFTCELIYSRNSRATWKYSASCLLPCKWYVVVLYTHISMPASASRLSTIVNVNNWTHNHFVEWRGAISHAGRTRIEGARAEAPGSSEHRPRGLGAAGLPPPPHRMRRLLAKWAD